MCLRGLALIYLISASELSSSKSRRDDSLFGFLVSGKYIFMFKGLDTLFALPFDQRFLHNFRRGLIFNRHGGSIASFDSFHSVYLFGIFINFFLELSIVSARPKATFPHLFILCFSINYNLRRQKQYFSNDRLFPFYCPDPNIDDNFGFSIKITPVSEKQSFDF